MDPLRTAIIGVSGYGNTHYAMLLAQAGRGALRPVAATVINPDDEAIKCARLRELGAELFTDDREMFARHAGRLDLCFIPTGLALHAKMALRALAAGAHVYVEKPLAATIQDALAVAAAATRDGRRVAVGYQHLYHPALLERKQRLRELTGELRVLKCQAVVPRSSLYYARNGWAGRLRHGGRWVLDAPFHNAGAHTLSLMCFLAGETAEDPATLASVRAELYRAAPIESCDLAGLEITTADGVRLLFLISHCDADDPAPAADPSFVIAGTRGALALAADGWHRWDGQRLSGDPLLPPFETGAADAIMARVLDAARGGAPFPCRPELAIPEVLAANAAFESSAIHPLPAGLVAALPAPKGGTVATVRGLRQAMDSAFRRDTLFADAGVAWAVPGAPVELRGYARFAGGRTGVGG